MPQKYISDTSNAGHKEIIGETMQKDLPEVWDEYNQTIKYWQDFPFEQEKLNKNG